MKRTTNKEKYTAPEVVSFEIALEQCIAASATEVSSFDELGLNDLLNNELMQ
jgi:hypothetical protein